MHVLEENYLRTIMLLDNVTKKITKRFRDLNVTRDEFAKKHLAYIDLNMSFYHLAIFQARKLYEADIREGLSDEDWFRLKSLREEVTHAKETKSKEISAIGDLNEDVIPILNRLSLSIHTKYDLDKDEKYQKFVENYFKDLDRL